MIGEVDRAVSTPLFKRTTSAVATYTVCSGYNLECIQRRKYGILVLDDADHCGMCGFITPRSGATSTNIHMEFYDNRWHSG